MTAHATTAQHGYADKLRTARLGLWLFILSASFVFGGLMVPQASVFASVLAVIGFINQVPFLEKFLEYLLFGRRRRRSTNQRNSRSRR